MDALKNSFHNYSAIDIDGNPIPTLGSILPGKKCIMVVNVASRCGLTNIHYTQLTQLYKDCKEQGLEIIAYPCNQFGGQEPGTNSEIKEFAQKKYGAEYPLMGKVDVNGANEAEVYKFMKAGTLPKVKQVHWNFGKFLVNGRGKVLSYHHPQTMPLDMIDDIKNCLKD
ncbi:hypothetical protein FGO68_gene278 [Halteria grandinella]|uniref:Glutathione peroxidase n=1 Tax=Halteria grandinella TaxID=5974 RepID=A0A8J8NIH0_HALGN|nr:hypothetical protein FGO68_gene278 [Halteria grandinella]